MTVVKRNLRSTVAAYRWRVGRVIDDAHPLVRRSGLAGLVIAGLALLYSLPVLTIPIINTPQTSFASVLFYPVGVYVLLALGLDMTVGRTGQVNLGYAAFFATGAYTTGLLTTKAGMSYYETIVPAVVLSMGLGLVVGVASLRVSRDYFAIVTLGIGLVVQELLVNVQAFGGTIGISSIPAPGALAGLRFGVLSPDSYDWLVFTMILVVGGVLYVIYRSSVGRAWASIREDEGAAELMGVKVRKLKVLASAVGAAPGGLAGSIYAAQVGYISPDTFGLSLSILALAAVALGGKGRIAGVVLGGVLVGYLPERFLAIDRFDTLMFGAIIVVVMLFRPQGILGVASSRRFRVDPVLARSVLEATPKGDPRENSALEPTGGTVRGRNGGMVLLGSASGDPSASPVARVGIRATRAEPALGIAAAARESSLGQLDEPLLRVEGARVSFGGVVALDGVTITVPPASVTSIIGPNGAGKTTLINAITGAIRLDAGRISLGSRDLTRTAVSERAHGGIGRTFQNIRLFGGMSVLENVLVAAEAGGRQAGPSGGTRSRRRTSELAGTAHALLDAVGLSDHASARAAELPYGAQRRLEIARALALDPEVLLLDEPAAGANTAEKQEVAALIEQIARSGRAVLLVEHDMPLVMEISTTVAVLNFGRLIATGPPAAVRADSAVIEAYLGGSHDG